LYWRDVHATGCFRPTGRATKLSGLGKTEILAVPAGNLQLNTSTRLPPPTFCWLNPSRFSHNVAPAWTRRRCRQASMISKYDTGTVFFEKQCALEETRSSEQLAAGNSLLGQSSLRNPAPGRYFSWLSGKLACHVSSCCPYLPTPPSCAISTWTRCEPRQYA
jgi:hypothetical protein